MSEDRRPVQGPPMICATDAIKTGPARIGHLVGNISLPRTVELSKALAVLGGVLAGLVLAVFVPADSMQKWVFGATFGGLAGWFLASYSPLQGESMLTWIGLQARTLTKQRHVDGKPVVVAVGSAAVGRESLGRVRVHRSAVRVPAGRYDARGVLVSARNHNVPDGAHVFGGHVYTPPTAPLAAPLAAPLPDPLTPTSTVGAGPAPAAPPAAASAPVPASSAASPRPLTLAERRATTGRPGRPARAHRAETGAAASRLRRPDRQEPRP